MTWPGGKCVAIQSMMGRHASGCSGASARRIASGRASASSELPTVGAARISTPASATSPLRRAAGCAERTSATISGSTHASTPASGTIQIMRIVR
jgi:hypothetical protein